VSINGSAANLAAGSALSRFAAQELLRILTEHFFLYRFVVFCPDKMKTSIEVKKARNSRLRRALIPADAPPLGRDGSSAYQAKPAKFRWRWNVSLTVLNFILLAVKCPRLLCQSRCGVILSAAAFQAERRISHPHTSVYGSFGSRKPTSGAKARPILEDLTARLKSCPSPNLFEAEFSRSLLAAALIARYPFAVAARSPS
jgi:hypothetical protein